MSLTASAEITVRCPREDAFQFLTDCDAYPRFLLPLFPLAGVRSADLLDAEAPATGVVRRVELTDGNVIQETIDEHRSPEVHRYSWGEGLRPPLSLIVRCGRAAWTFTEVEAGTHVQWAYEFDPTTVLVLPVAKPLFLRFQTWMKRGLEQGQSILESR